MKIHPLAEFFPMMTEEELQTLASDIKANGLLHPLIVDADNQLIDGRNRLAACKLVGVEPTFEPLGDRDPVAIIMSANVVRRNLSKGQQAMAVAKAYPEGGGEGGRGNKKKILSIQFTFSEALLKHARFILQYAPDLVPQVMAGASLKDAYDAASTRKREREELEAKIAARKLMLEEIGTPVPLNLTVDLNIHKAETVLPSLPSKEVLKAQEQVLISLMTMYQQLDKMVTEELIPPSFDHAGFVNGIRSSVVRIINSATKLVDNYNKSLAAPSIKRVK